MISDFTGRFTDKDIGEVFKIGRMHFLAGKELQDTVQLLKKKGDILYAGILLGEEKGKDFFPSLSLLDVLKPLTGRKVVIDDKAEWLFLCGRDVFNDSVVKSNVDSGVALVLNKRDEVLGYGKVINKGNIYLKNILDKGDYLRREMTHK